MHCSKHSFQIERKKVSIHAMYLSVSDFPFTREKAESYFRKLSLERSTASHSINSSCVLGFGALFPKILSKERKEARGRWGVSIIGRNNIEVSTTEARTSTAAIHVCECCVGSDNLDNKSCFPRNLHG